MSTTYSRNRVGVVAPASAVLSHVGLFSRQMGRRCLRFLRRQITSSSAIRPVRSTFQEHIEFDMLFVVPFKNYKVSSSRRVSASSCKLGTFLCFFVQQWFAVWLIRLPMTKIAGSSLQGLECIFYFSQGCLCKEANVILYPM